MNEPTQQDASPEPVSNWTVSIAEDLAVFGGLWAALNFPVLFLGLLAVFIVAMIWLLPRIWRGVRAVFRRLARWFSGAAHPEEPAAQTPGRPGELRFSLSAAPPDDPSGQGRPGG